MPFRSNFVAVRRGEGTLRIEGETNRELLDAAERMYVGVAPAKPETQELTVYEVPLLSDWSVEYDPGAFSRRRLTCVGIVILRDGPPFMWTQVMPTVSAIRARPQAEGEQE